MEIEESITALASLAQETRLRIFRLLVRQGPKGMAAGKIAERLGIPANTLSFHLTHLARAGLIVSRREGRVIAYAIVEAGIRGLIAYLIEDCCGDRPELCGIVPSTGLYCPPPSSPRSTSPRKNSRVHTRKIAGRLRSKRKG